MAVRALIPCDEGDEDYTPKDRKLSLKLFENWDGKGLLDYSKFYRHRKVLNRFLQCSICDYVEVRRTPQLGSGCAEDGEFAIERLIVEEQNFGIKTRPSTVYINTDTNEQYDMFNVGCPRFFSLDINKKERHYKFMFYDNAPERCAEQLELVLKSL